RSTSLLRRIWREVDPHGAAGGERVSGALALRRSLTVEEHRVQTCCPRCLRAHRDTKFHTAGCTVNLGCPLRHRAGDQQSPSSTEPQPPAGGPPPGPRTLSLDSRSAPSKPGLADNFSQSISTRLRP